MQPAHCYKKILLMACFGLSAFTTTYSALAATPRAAEDADSPVTSSDTPFQRYANPSTKKVNAVPTTTKVGKKVAKTTKERKHKGRKY